MEAFPTTDNVEPTETWLSNVAAPPNLDVDLAEKSHESGKKIYDRDNPDVNKKEEESKDFSNLLKELSD